MDQIRLKNNFSTVGNGEVISVVREVIIVIGLELWQSVVFLNDLLFFISWSILCVMVVGRDDDERLLILIFFWLDLRSLGFRIII